MHISDVGVGEPKSHSDASNAIGFSALRMSVQGQKRRLRADGRASTSAMRRQRPDAATTDAGYNRVAASCKVHLVRPTCFMYVAKSQ